MQLVALCSRSQASMDRALQRLEVRDGSIRCYTALEDLLADADVDCVDLCLPIPEIPRAVRAALAAGKAVLSEKPAAPSPAEALELWRAYADPTGGAQPWAVLENFGRKPTVLRFEELLRAQCVGRPRSYAAALHQTPPDAAALGWRAGAGAAEGAAGAYTGGWSLDVGVHLARALRVWFGEAEAARGVRLAGEGDGGGGGGRGRSCAAS